MHSFDQTLGVSVVVVLKRILVHLQISYFLVATIFSNRSKLLIQLTQNIPNHTCHLLLYYIDDKMPADLFRRKNCAAFYNISCLLLIKRTMTAISAHLSYSVCAYANFLCFKYLWFEYLQLGFMFIILTWAELHWIYCALFARTSEHFI
jgi:hypothetical protein